MPHICMDEVFAFMALFPFIGYFFAKLHVWWHEKFNHKCHKESCEDNCVEHIESIVFPPPGYSSTKETLDFTISKIKSSEKDLYSYDEDIDNKW